MNDTNENPFSDFEIISSYSRQNAIDDGSLVDVSETAEARELRIRFPIALTSRVWKECVEVPTNVVGQDRRGRLWDVLYMFVLAARRTSGDRLTFSLNVRNDSRKGEPPTIKLMALCGPGDTPEPVITIMFPDED